MTCIFSRPSDARDGGDGPKSDFLKTLTFSAFLIFPGDSGAIIELRKGDVLGHECCGRVESVGPAVKTLKAGDSVVVGFNVACGECFMCQKKLSSACVMTNSSSTMQTMYGGRTCTFSLFFVPPSLAD